MMNDIRHKFPRAVVTHSLSFCTLNIVISLLIFAVKAAGYDEWQNYGTVKGMEVILNFEFFCQTNDALLILS